MSYKAMRLDGMRAKFGVAGKSPGYLTVVSTTDAVNESREATRDRSFGRWTISFPDKPLSEFEDFVAFFRIAQGRRHSWGFRDPIDYICTTAQSRLVQLTSTTWQMYRRRSYAGYNDDAIIILPRNGLTSVAGGGVYTISYTTGVITKVSGADPTTFATEFDKLCRFDVDDLEYTIDDKGKGQELLIMWSAIPIFEIPLSAA